MQKPNVHLLSSLSTSDFTMSKGYEMPKGYDMSKQYMSKPYERAAAAAAGSAGMMYTPAQALAMSPSGVMLSGASQPQSIIVNPASPYAQQSVLINQTPGMMSLGSQSSSYPYGMQSAPIYAGPLPQYQLYSTAQQMTPASMSAAPYNQVSYTQQQKYLDKDVHMMTAAANSAGMHHVVGNQSACMRMQNAPPHGAMYAYSSPGMTVAYPSTNSSAAVDMPGTRK